ncbi:MAG TPA: helix-turn-helix domain-containing protein [Thermoplasmata archaeon]|jgi:DNA-binding NtrC family response regulator
MDALGRAVLESLDQGIAVFDAGGRLVYANPAARRVLADSNGNGPDARRALLDSQGHAVALHDGPTPIGEAVFVAGNGQAGTLAQREREAILEALAATGGRLAEAARKLGISRTTLWRRLRVYGDGERPSAVS